MKKRFLIQMTGVALAAVLLSGCTSNPEDSIFDPNAGMPAMFEPTDESSYEEEFHPEDWIEYDEEGEPILPDGVEKSDVFDDAGNFIGDPSMFGFISGSGNHSVRTDGQNGGQAADGSFVNGDGGAVYSEGGDGTSFSEEGQMSEDDWSESSDDSWEEESDSSDSDDDGWVEDTDDGEDDEDDGVELWNGTGEWNGY